MCPNLFEFDDATASLAIDLDLYRVPEVMPSDERGEREVLNRLRTYICIYIADRGTCLNLGKPFMVPEVEVRPLCQSCEDRRWLMSCH